MHKPTSDACARVPQPHLPRKHRYPFAVQFHLPVRLSQFCALAVAVAMLLPGGLSTAPCFAQDTTVSPKPNSTDELLQGIPDVTILVIPTSGDTARVALSYVASVPHERVKKEIARLSANGWGIGKKVVVEDYTIRPGAPVATSARFSLIKAPQVLNNAPVILPYLQAFQDNDRIDVFFSLPNLVPYNGVDVVDNRELSIRRSPEEGAYHYVALIRDHKGRLPELLVGNQSQAVATAADTKPAIRRLSSISLLPLMLIVLGAGVLGGLAVYSLVVKRRT